MINITRLLEHLKKKSTSDTIIHAHIYECIIHTFVKVKGILFY